MPSEAPGSNGSLSLVLVLAADPHLELVAQQQKE
jgi:hypothetical protein